MRLVLDTNILLSALMVRGTPPDYLYNAWRQGRFELATAEQQLEELNRVSRRPFFQERLKPSEIGRMINDIHRIAILCDPLPVIECSPDPDDDYLLATAQKASANYLVTGDKSDLLALKLHEGTRIISAREMMHLLEK
ncbi:MAG: putative toxin-antitoxin system toxin component, PIN family [Thiolinea sp.]